MEKPQIALLVSLNSKYEHENPAVWYLKAAYEQRKTQESLLKIQWKIIVLSKTINDDPDHIFAEIIERQPDVVAFSCYIWNRDETLRIASDIRSALPASILVAGGPEVSYGNGAEEYKNAGIDIILAGEGEEKFPDMLEAIACRRDLTAELLDNWGKVSPSLPAEKLVSPICDEYLSNLKGRIAYIESSRGCPFSCSYCLSSACKTMTYIPLERVFYELEQLVLSGAKVIKFVDRTFNLTDQRTLAIWEHLLKYADTPVVFHFEVAPDLLTGKQLELLSLMPLGLIQIEAGLQSVHTSTLHEIDRMMNVEQAITNMQKVLLTGNVHLHADLIAGLPGEDLVRFTESVNVLSRVMPHHLQIGFLKLLRGTKMWQDAKKYNFIERFYAPYEVIASDALPVYEMLKIKDLEETVERFYNSGRFLFVMQHLLKNTESAFSLYAQLSQFQKEKKLFHRAVSSDVLFQCMASFINNECSAKDREELMSLLRLDWVTSHKNPFLPDYLRTKTETDTLLVKTNWLEIAYGNDITVQVGSKSVKNRFYVEKWCFPVIKFRGMKLVNQWENHKSLYVIIDTRIIHRVLGRPEVILFYS